MSFKKSKRAQKRSSTEIERNDYDAYSVVHVSRAPKRRRPYATPNVIFLPSVILHDPQGPKTQIHVSSTLRPVRQIAQGLDTVEGHGGIEDNPSADAPRRPQLTVSLASKKRRVETTAWMHQVIPALVPVLWEVLAETENLRALEQLRRRPQCSCLRRRPHQFTCVGFKSKVHQFIASAGH